jgi:hypothetical protein
MILSDKKNKLIILGTKSTIVIPIVFLDETISWYQTADYLFTEKLLK